MSGPGLFGILQSPLPVASTCLGVTWSHEVFPSASISNKLAKARRAFFVQQANRTREPIDLMGTVLCLRPACLYGGFSPSQCWEIEKCPGDLGKTILNIPTDALLKPHPSGPINPFMGIGIFIFSSSVFAALFWIPFMFSCVFTITSVKWLAMYLLPEPRPVKFLPTCMICCQLHYQTLKSYMHYLSKKTEYLVHSYQICSSCLW